MSTRTWTGDSLPLTTNWFNIGNWSGLIRPGADDLAVLDDTTDGNQPEITGTGNLAEISALLIENGLDLTVDSGGELTVFNTIQITGGVDDTVANSALIVNSGAEVSVVNAGDEILVQQFGGNGSFGHGELVIGGLGTAKAMGNGFVDAGVSLDGTKTEFLFNTTDNVVFSNVISGTGFVEIQGSGATVTFTNLGDSYTGTTTIDGGATLQLGDGGSGLGEISGGSAIIDNGTLAIDNNATGGPAPTSVISGSGALHLMVGEAELKVSDTYTGATTIDSGARLDLGIGADDVTLATSSVADNGVLAFDYKLSYTIGYGITGTGAVDLFGSGGIILDGNDTYSGGSFTSSGTTITVGANDTKGGVGSGNILNDGMLQFNRTDTITYSGAISGTGAVKQIGAGTTILTGANTYSGQTTISSGALQIGNATTKGALGTGAIVDNGALSLVNTGQITIASAISGTGLLVKSGSNLLTLTGANSFGQTIIAAGSLAIGADNAAGSLGTDLVFDNGDLDFSRSDATTVGNQIIGSGAVDQFFGTTTLTGTNIYTGTTNVDSGVLKGGAANAISPLSSSVTVDSGATLDLDGFDESIFNLTGAGTVDNSGAAPVTLTVATISPQTFSGVIEDTGGPLELVLNDTAALTLSGANTYTGGTQLNSGALNVGSLGSGAVVDNGALNLTGGGSFGAISGNGSVTVNGSTTFSGANTYTGPTTIGSAGVLTIGVGGSLGNGGAVTDNGLLIFTGTGTQSVNNSISGTGGLSQNGSGTTVLTGNDSYQDDTFVLAGTLRAGAANAFSANSKFFSIAGGAFLDLGGFSQEVKDLQGAGTINNSGAFATLTINDGDGLNPTISGLIENTGGALSLFKLGGNTTFLAHTNTYTGSTTVDDGVLTAGATNAFGANSAVTVASGAALNLQGHDETIASVAGSGTIENFAAFSGATLTIADTTSVPGGTDIITALITSSSLSLTIGAKATVLLQENNTYGGTTTINGFLTIGDITSSGTLGTGAVVDNKSLTFERNDNFTVANVISGSGSVTTEFGAYTFTGDDTLTGVTTIQSGSLQIGNGGTSGRLGTGAIHDQTTLIFDLALNPAPVVISNAISGPGGVSFFDDDVYVLTGANSYGGTGIGALSHLIVGNGGTSGTLDSSSVNDAGILEFNRSNALTVAGGISGSGQVSQTGTGTTTVSGVNTYTGGTSVGAGVLKAGHDNAFGSGPVKVTNSGTLDLSGFSENEAITNQITVTDKTGVGKLTGALTNNGLLSAAGGGIVVSQAVTGNGSAAISGGGALTFNGAFNQAVAFSGAGSLTISQNYQGAVTGFGAGDTISYTGTVWAALSGSGGAANLTSSQLSVTGGGDKIGFAGGTGNVVSLYKTNGNFDTVNGSNGQVILTTAQASVVGGADVIYTVGASTASLYSTAGKFDTVNGAGATTILETAQASIVGKSNIIYTVGASTASLYSTAGTFDTVNGSGATVLMTSAQASVVGGSDTVTMTSGSTVSLYSTSGHWDTVNGSSGTVLMTSVQASVVGGSDTITMTSGSTLSLYSTSGHWDTVNGSGDAVILTTAQASIVGGSNTITPTKGSSISLFSTGGHADVVNGSGEQISLVGSQAALTGSTDTVFFSGTSALTLNGTSDAFDFAKALGLATISGFVASDVIHLSAQDWTSFNALNSSGDLVQSGANTLIKLDASDQITLVNVQKSSLTTSQFAFA